MLRLQLILLLLPAGPGVYVVAGVGDVVPPYPAVAAVPLYGGLLLLLVAGGAGGGVDDGVLLQADVPALNLSSDL